MFILKAVSQQLLMIYLITPHFTRKSSDLLNSHFRLLFRNNLGLVSELNRNTIRFIAGKETDDTAGTGCALTGAFSCLCDENG